MSPTCNAAASPSRSPANAQRPMKALKLSSAHPSSAPTCSTVGSCIDDSARRVLGRSTPIAGSDGIMRSRTAARSTARTLLNRVLIVPGASPRSIIDLTHDSTCEARKDDIRTRPNVTDSAARFIASVVPGAQALRAAHCS